MIFRSDRALRVKANPGVEFVAALADTVLIAHAQPRSKTEQLAQEVVGWGKQVYTLDHPANEHLLALGAMPLAPTYRKELC